MTDLLPEHGIPVPDFTTNTLPPSSTSMASGPITVTPDPDEFICVECGTAEHLEVEDIQSLEPNAAGSVMTEYSCGACESFYAHEVPVQSLVKFLAITDAPAGVLQTEGRYIHCGVPMEEKEMNLFPAFDTVPLLVHSAETIAPTATEPLMPTMILKCRCGFQISTPH